MSVATAQPGKTRVGFIGTGVMGHSMAGHLLHAGFPLTVFSRTKAKAASLLEAGAHWADSPKAVAARSDVICTIVGYPKDVREVLLSKGGALAGAAAGSQ